MEALQAKLGNSHGIERSEGSDVVGEPNAVGNDPDQRTAEHVDLNPAGILANGISGGHHVPAMPHSHLPSQHHPAVVSFGGAAILARLDGSALFCSRIASLYAGDMKSLRHFGE